ncbi:MAG: dethiobiotin synthase [Pirellulales bacterium]|nr:dethiobiotin synthase [Pirellulales bacterium]
MRKPPPGLFITGNDTDVGKTYVAALIAQELRRRGQRVGVYKPVASGCYWQDEQLISGDALKLWEAAGRPGALAQVCPQRFEAALAPHLAARREGREIDVPLLVAGRDAWCDDYDVVLVEGAGGLMSPLSDELFVADLAEALGYPLVVVARNAVGVINQALLTLIAAVSYGEGLAVAGLVLNEPQAALDAASRAEHREELAARAVPPILAEVHHGAGSLDREVDWLALADWKPPAK